MTSLSSDKWDRDSWRTRTRVQMPTYNNLDNLKMVEKTLNGYPPLVFAGETRILKLN